MQANTSSLRRLPRNHDGPKANSLEIEGSVFVQVRAAAAAAGPAVPRGRGVGPCLGSFAFSEEAVDAVTDGAAGSGSGEDGDARG